MANGTCNKPQDYLILFHQLTLLSAVTIEGRNSYTVLSNTDLTTFEYYALDYVPTGRTLVGAIYCWSNGSNCIPVDTLVINGKLSLTLYNLKSESITLTTVRLLCFWK